MAPEWDPPGGAYLRRLIPEKALSPGTRESDSLTAVEEWMLARPGEKPRSGSTETTEPALLIALSPREWNDGLLGGLVMGSNEAEGVVLVWSFAGDGRALVERNLGDVGEVDA